MDGWTVRLRSVAMPNVHTIVTSTDSSPRAEVGSSSTVVSGLDCEMHPCLARLGLSGPDSASDWGGTRFNHKGVMGRDMARYLPFKRTAGHVSEGREDKSRSLSSGVPANQRGSNSEPGT